MRRTARPSPRQQDLFPFRELKLHVPSELKTGMQNVKNFTYDFERKFRQAVFPQTELKLYEPPAEPETVSEALQRIRAFSDNQHLMAREIRALDDSIRIAVAHRVFGQKLAGDLGFRSTRGHPTSDYGEPSFVGGWDLGEK